MEGWIKLHRKIMDHWIFQDAEYLKFWIYLLLDVNHQDRKIIWNKEVITVKRGEKITSLKKLSYEFKCSREKVRHFLKLLKNDTMIDIIHNTNYTHLKICNYDSYQIEPHTEKTARKQPENSEKTVSDTNKNVKKGKNDKNIIPEWQEFLEYAREKEPQVLEKALKLKYEAWKESGWKTGGKKPHKIQNWKTTLLNTLPYVEKDTKYRNKPDSEFDDKIR